MLRQISAQNNTHFTWDMNRALSNNILILSQFMFIFLFQETAERDSDRSTPLKLMTEVQRPCQTFRSI